MWDSMIEMMELVMQHIVEIAILCFEFIGVIVIIISGAKGFWNYVRREPEMKITLAQGLAVGLEFKLCSESCRYYRPARRIDLPDSLGDQGRSQGRAWQEKRKQF